LPSASFKVSSIVISNVNSPIGGSIFTVLCHTLPVNVGNMKVAGVSGIIGNVRRPWRKSPDEFRAALAHVTSKTPDVLILHDGPDAPNPAISDRH